MIFILNWATTAIPSKHNRKVDLKHPCSETRAKIFIVIFIFFFDIALFLLSAVKNHFYIILPDESVIRPDLHEFLYTHFPCFLASYGQDFFVSLPFLVISFFMFIQALRGANLRLCALAIVFSSILWWAVGRILDADVGVEAFLYAALLLGVLVVEGVVFLSGTLKGRGFTYPLCIAILLNAYVVYALLTVDGGLGYVVVLIAFIIASFLIRRAWLRLRESTDSGNVLVLLLVLMLCGVFLLLMSYYDFAGSADNGGAWRALYYLLVIVILVAGHIMPVATDLLRERDDRGGLFGHRSGLLISAACAMVLPLLCALSVHGVVVLIVAPLLSLTSFLFAAYCPYVESVACSKRRYVASFFLLLLTVVCMFVDPIIYISPENRMNALVPAVASVLGATALATTRRLYLDGAGDGKTELVDAVVDILTARSPFDYIEKAQIMILAANALTIAIFVLLFTAYQLSLKPLSEAVSAFAPMLGGVGGLYRFSWATVSAVASILVVDAARILSLRYGNRELV